jgi:uroporphyrinogen decarboxylase
LDVHFAEMLTGNAGDIEMFFKYYCEFFQKMTYDTVSCEMCITEILPGHGALMGGIQGPIQTRKDFENYPWKELPDVYWHIADSRFSALLKMMPAGMKAVGGIGNGIFEISEDLVGYEYLSYMQVDDPELFADIYVKIGDLMLTLWKRFVAVYGQSGFCCLLLIRLKHTYCRSTEGLFRLSKKRVRHFFGIPVGLSLKLWTI